MKLFFPFSLPWSRNLPNNPPMPPNLLLIRLSQWPQGYMTSIIRIYIKNNIPLTFFFYFWSQNYFKDIWRASPWYPNSQDLQDLVTKDSYIKEGGYSKQGILQKLDGALTTWRWQDIQIVYLAVCIHCCSGAQNIKQPHFPQMPFSFGELFVQKCIALKTQYETKSITAEISIKLVELNENTIPNMDSFFQKYKNLVHF